jgi:glycosyltransferase involved in cell wall biosynthesis
MKPKALIYDPHMWSTGGPQQIVAATGCALKDQYEVTIAGPEGYTISQLEDLFYFKLDGCKRIVTQDPSQIATSFDLMFVSHATWIRPLARCNLLYCHFPLIKPGPSLSNPLALVRRDKSFFAGMYELVLCNSGFTKGEIIRRWRVGAQILYPCPSPLKIPNTQKKPIILNVSRFEPVKKQHLLVEGFKRLCRFIEGWELVLCGNLYDRDYFEMLQADSQGYPVRLLCDLSRTELQTLYAQSQVFWHLCGMGEDSPEKMEHFGIVLVEAIQSGVVPVVYCGGGVREIIRPGIEGYLVKTLDELIKFTLDLVRYPALRETISQAACKRAQGFSFDNFRARLLDIIERVARRRSGSVPT